MTPAPVVLLGIVLNALAALVLGGLHLLLEPPPPRAGGVAGITAVLAAGVAARYQEGR
jgi:hypothetical protein